MATITPRKRKAVDFSEPTVTVVVGASQKIFTLHPSFLVTGSKFFRSALSGPWKESLSKKITLPETSIEVFQSYAVYVYTGEIDICAEPLDEASDPEARQTFYQLAELYSLADVTLDDKALRNAVIEAIVNLEEKSGYQPSFAAIKHAYENSSGTTPLCRLLLDNALAGTHPDWLRVVWNELPEEFITSLMYGWAQASCDKAVSYKSSTEVSKCRYHEHDADVPPTKDCVGKEEAVIVQVSLKKKRTPVKRGMRSGS
ncbi:uncharacterized protein RCC_07300 [Ramularia collo-cygni]|uniref:BTB domain-containing protein n=1 Tax=Ramularia collo-cygni TaxID=112498 RepID=A0A2D3V9J8_9PEZI|nr:uncharacterized protein RCC_07300 [Ramularia collo-cygni]CZT21437.1 uncharacterized protein RCC_07300 [Ramularia collo-cygni]